MEETTGSAMSDGGQATPCNVRLKLSHKCRGHPNCTRHLCQSHTTGSALRGPCGAVPVILVVAAASGLPTPLKGSQVELWLVDSKSRQLMPKPMIRLGGDTHAFTDQAPLSIWLPLDCGQVDLTEVVVSKEHLPPHPGKTISVRLQARLSRPDSQPGSSVVAALTSEPFKVVTGRTERKYRPRQAGRAARVSGGAKAARRRPAAAVAAPSGSSSSSSDCSGGDSSSSEGGSSGYRTDEGGSRSSSSSDGEDAGSGDSSSYRHRSSFDDSSSGRTIFSSPSPEGTDLAAADLAPAPHQQQRRRQRQQEQEQEQDVGKRLCLGSFPDTMTCHPQAAEEALLAAAGTSVQQHPQRQLSLSDLSQIIGLPPLSTDGAAAAAAAAAGGCIDHMMDMPIEVDLGSGSIRYWARQRDSCGRLSDSQWQELRMNGFWLPHEHTGEQVPLGYEGR